VNALISVLIVCVVCSFWVIVFSRAFLKSISGSRENEHKRGERLVTGTVISSENKGSGRLQRLTIVIEFPNFSNADVQETFSFRDLKPEEMRYEKGRSVQLVIDESIKKGPVIRLASTKKRKSNRVALFFFVLSAGSLYGSYLIYKFIEKQLGGDWNNIDQLATQEVLPIVAGSFIFSLVMMKFVFRAVKLSPGQKGIKTAQKLKLHGARATATITKVEETGTRINNDPMIRFHYEFKDHFGETHTGVDRMVVGIMDIGGIKNEKEREVLYLKDEPSSSRLMEAMKGNALAGCSKFIFLFIIMIYSIIILSIFFASIPVT
jgi:hypothetical protein